MRTLTIALAMLLTVPASALAASPLKPVPPSNSAANQYVEVVPTAGGGTPATGITQHSSSSRLNSSASAPAGSSLSAPTRAALAASGRDGRRVALLARATAPAREKTTRQSKQALGAAGTGSSSGGSGGSGAVGSTGSGAPVGAAPASAVVKSLTGGVGSGLPIALAVLALGISGVALLRRRHTT
jgi:hypothetical protein